MAKRTKPPRNTARFLSNEARSQKQLQALSALITRASLMTGLGHQYEGDRKLYQALGYKTDPTFDDYYGLWSREGVAFRVAVAPANAVWSSSPRIYDRGENDPTPFETSLEKLIKNHKLWSRFNRVDTLLAFGEYAVLLLGFNDVQGMNEFQQPVTRQDLELVYVQCYSSHYAEIKEYDKDPNSPRYGMPEIYEIRLSEIKGADVKSSTSQYGASKLLVHHSRILHIVENNLQNEVFGEPRLKRTLNRLDDLQKVLGGSAEMFWRGARPGNVAELKDGYEWNTDDPSFTEMQNQMEEYEHNLRRTLYLAGVDMKSLAPQVADPASHVDVLLQDISAATNIPKRILVGSERGELASTQDEGNWSDYITDRMQNWAEPHVLEPFIDRMIEYGVIDEPFEDDYSIEWPDLKTPSPKELAEIGKIRAESLSKYADSANSSMILPMEMFMRHYQGLSEEQIQEVLEWQEEQLAVIADEDAERGNEENDLESDAE